MSEDQDKINPIPANPDAKLGRITIIFDFDTGNMAHIVDEIEGGAGSLMTQEELTQIVTPYCFLLYRQEILGRYARREAAQPKIVIPGHNHFISKGGRHGGIN